MLKNLFDILLGRHLSNEEEQEHRIGPLEGIPVLGLDALGSSAYGPEAAATLLLPLGIAGTKFVLPVVLCLIVLLLIVYFSYRQTISAYPEGGGSYTVARENLGPVAGLIAGAALMLDYVLVVAVGISAGVGALISAIPSLQSHTLALCLVTLTLISGINLRGVKESGFAFIVPTYVFVFSTLGVLVWGVFQTILAGGHPVALVNRAISPMPTLETASLWLLVRSFASGCTAMTGVEAISNGVKLFREPTVKNAKRSLGIIIGILALLLLGIAYLAQAYGISATNPGEPGYESLVSQLVAAIVGRGSVYYVTIASVIAVLLLSANTGLADFPRICQILANDNYLPHILAERGRRLVFSAGIISITILSAILLIFFDGVTDRLIPLFAIGALLAFTMSQTGMVAHWLKNMGQKDRKNKPYFSIAANALGAVGTGVALLAVMISKFTEGGWFTLVCIPTILTLFYAVKRHYDHIARQLHCIDPLNYDHMRSPVVIVAIRNWNRMTRKALRFAMNITPEIYGVYVDSGRGTVQIDADWEKYVTAPAHQWGYHPPRLIKLKSPYRQLNKTIMDLITQLEKDHPNRQVAVLIPRFVEQKWYHYILHNHRSVLFTAALRLRADPRVIIISVPWYLQ